MRKPFAVMTKQEKRVVSVVPELKQNKPSIEELTLKRVEVVQALSNIVCLSCTRQPIGAA